MTATDERGPKAQHDDVGQSWPGDGAMGWEVDDAGSEGRPRRVQLRRTSGWRKPAGAVVVARPTKWGNPVVVGSQASLRGIDADGLQYSYQVIVTPQIAVDAFRDLMSTRLTVLDPDEPEDAANVQGWRDALALLRGHDLACWCPLRDPLGNPVPCHADVLLELARPAPPPTPAPRVRTPVPPLDPPPVLTCAPLRKAR